MHRQAAELQESNGLLKQREEALRIQSDRFSSAIEHMAQGLCMIDEDRRLITWNAKFATMYGIPDELLREGAPYLPVLEHRIKSDSAPSDCADFIQRELGARGEQGGHREIVELPDGRFIAASFEPTPEGGLLSTYLDITQRAQKRAAGHPSRAPRRTHRSPESPLLRRTARKDDGGICSSRRLGILRHRSG